MVKHIWLSIYGQVYGQAYLARQPYGQAYSPRGFSNDRITLSKVNSSDPSKELDEPSSQSFFFTVLFFSVLLFLSVNKQ